MSLVLSGELSNSAACWNAITFHFSNGGVSSKGKTGTNEIQEERSSRLRSFKQLFNFAAQIFAVVLVLGLVELQRILIGTVTRVCGEKVF